MVRSCSVERSHHQFDLCLTRDLIVTVVFLPNFVLVQILLEGERWSSHLLRLAVKSEWKFHLSCVCTSSDKLGVCHVRRTISRDRRISVMEMETARQLMLHIFN